MDIHFIRNNKTIAEENQEKRFGDKKIIDKILLLDEEWKKNNQIIIKYRELKNNINSAYKKAPTNGIHEFENNYTQEDLVQDLNLKNIKLNELTKIQLENLSKYLNNMIKYNEESCSQTLNERDKLISFLGNLLHKDVVISNNEDNNKIIYSKEIPEEFNNKKYDHHDLGRMLNFIDIENGTNVIGNRGYFLTGKGVKLNMAIINYGLDFLEKKGYTLVATPHFVNGDLMSKITQLSDYEETLYKLENNDKYLIATSEQPLTALFNDKILTKKSLPIKFAGISSCYRKETGRHGHAKNGIYRVHQFEKVEQFCVTEADKSWEVFNEMINTSKEFYDSLGINYRVVSIVSGALNNAASMKYDIEAFFPGSKMYGELVSCTNCLDYFSKRLGTKIKETKEYVHMLNCTLAANTRVICCLMETYQTETGMIIPEVLRKYMDCDFIPFNL